MIKKRLCFVNWVFVLVVSICLTQPVYAGDECTAVYGRGNNTFSLATGSPGELGMLKAIAEVFNSKNDTRDRKSVVLAKGRFRQVLATAQRKEG